MGFFNKIYKLIIVGWALISFLSFSHFSFSQGLNDTGISYAGTYPKGIEADCSSTASALIQQQDCATGQSAVVKAHSDSVFQYQKVSADGSYLGFDAKIWACVLDKVTGLMWEVKNTDKTPDNLHHVADQFTWYNSNPRVNGGDIGNWNHQGDSCYGYTSGKPRTYCHIEQFASRVNKQGLCGFNDWRVPSRAELTSLIHFGQFQPAIEKSYFPHTLSTFYWVTDPVPARPIEAWSVDFEFGTTSPLRKTDLRPVRLVRDAGLSK